MSIKKKDREIPDKDEKGEEARDNGPEAEEGTDTPGEKKPEAEEKKSGIKKWILIVVAGVILGVSGTGLVLMPNRFSTLFKEEFKGVEIIKEDNLSEEVMSPFFIPPGPSDKAIRIDLTIVWDGIASITFKKNELSARQMMSERFIKLAGQRPDLNVVKSDLENEIGSMLKSSLGVQILNIRIKEIRYF
ncbi:MAG: hypothetical protein GX846_02270 [Deltaproteobacteria bacterium]|nr:hypothetical protein [Deltaproteobacteria bacterium]